MQEEYSEIILTISSESLFHHGQAFLYHFQIVLFIHFGKILKI